MKTKLILNSGTEITVMHSIVEIENMIPTNSFLILKKEGNGEVQIKPEAIVYREEAPVV